MGCEIDLGVHKQRFSIFLVEQGRKEEKLVHKGREGLFHKAFVSGVCVCVEGKVTMKTFL